ncbi:MAG: hypoxanthine phosphoribosyltransferase [Paramuribaculum sp.]|nr:hypoxanthine phosphoribosyltransferase [Paramuribaculum sp.]
MRQVSFKGLTFEPYIENQRIQSRIRQIGEEITAEYKGRNPLFICVLTGAFPFAADLFRSIGTDAEITFVRLKSYEGTETTGKVREVMGLGEDIKGRPVIIVEDIIDTGHTIHGLLAQLREREPESIKIATLLFKPDSLQKPVRPDYIGFSIPPKFIIGFGLDIDGQARNLPDIWVLSDRHDN